MNSNKISRFKHTGSNSIEFISECCFITIALVIVMFSLCSCTKQVQHAPSETYEFPKDLDRARTNEKVAAVLEEIGAAMTNDIALESISAVEHFKHLHDEGSLPGTTKNEHGEFICDNEQVTGNTISYPVTRTFRFVKKGENSTNIYKLVRGSKTAEWQIQKAWKTDVKGQIIQEWPIKKDQ